MKRHSPLAPPTCRRVCKHTTKHIRVTTLQQHQPVGRVGCVGKGPTQAASQAATRSPQVDALLRVTGLEGAHGQGVDRPDGQAAVVLAKDVFACKLPRGGRSDDHHVQAVELVEALGQLCLDLRVTGGRLWCGGWCGGDAAHALHSYLSVSRRPGVHQPSMTTTPGVRPAVSRSYAGVMGAHGTARCMYTHLGYHRVEGVGEATAAPDPGVVRGAGQLVAHWVARATCAWCRVNRPQGDRLPLYLTGWWRFERRLQSVLR